jgi:GWxTD domain-containing protein
VRLIPLKEVFSNVMKQHPWSYLAVIAAAPAAFAAQTPAEAIAAGRAAIEMKQFDRAIIVMQDAIPAATMLTNEKEKASALAAIHFYSALAFSELERDDKTREELREFFRFRPDAAKLEESKYPVPFVRAFNEVASTLPRITAHARANSFDLAYPGFNGFAMTKPRERAISEWNKSPEFVLLATEQEQRDWAKLADDDARRDFVSKFWSRRGVEFREEFERRAAFADDRFGSESLRGSLTDRGRVFVLVGIPNRVTIKPLYGSRVLPSRLGDINNKQGSMEQWIYERERLPVPLPVQQLEFDFIDAPDYGDHILQRDAYTIKELDAVKKKYAGTQ